MNDGIPISERPLNEFSNQIILKYNEKKTKINPKLTILFKRKKRIIIEHSKINDENVIVNIFKDFLSTKRVSAILTDDTTFKTVQSVYSSYFSSNKHLKLVRCNIFLEDVTEKDTQEKIIRDYHKYSNHRGIIETFNHLKRKYYFPNMKHTITSTINSCEICQKQKYDRKREPLKFEVTQTPSMPLEIVHVDIYSVCKQNFFTIIDKFSKFACVYLISARNSINIIKSLKHFFSHHGIPKLLISDNGSEFISSTFKEFLDIHMINHHTIFAKSSNGNSPLERFHSTLTEIIRIIKSQNNNKAIGEIIDEAVITYNNSVHSATKLTPFELLNGHISKRNPLFTKENSKTEQEYLVQHVEDYKKLTKLIHGLSLRNKQKNIEKRNENRTDPQDFVENETIYELDDRRNKLAPRFNEHKVVKNHKITITSNKRKVHKQKIRKKPKRKVSACSNKY